jgi:hypothetical protein
MTQKDKKSSRMSSRRRTTTKGKKSGKAKQNDKEELTKA